MLRKRIKYNQDDIVEIGSSSEETSDSVICSQRKPNDFVEFDNSDDENCSHIFEKYVNNNLLIILLKYSQEIKLYGISNVKVLYGKISIFGSSFKRNDEFSVYSPKGTSFLTIKNETNFCDNFHQLNKICHELKYLVDQKVTRKDCSILLFTKKTDYRFNFFEKYGIHTIIPDMGNNPAVIISPNDKCNVVEINKTLNELLANVINDTKLFLCGGKGLGKSTFLRYATNALLPKYKEIRVIDLDPGQSEFSVPGTLDVCIIREPLLGPSYTHLTKPHRSILCDKNVGHDPQKYLDAVEEITRDLPECGGPTIVNFVGYTSDLGYNVLCCALLIVRPNLLIELKSLDRKRNYPLPIGKSNIYERGTLLRKGLSFDFDIKFLEAVLEKRETAWDLQGREMREMGVMSYFGQMMTEHITSLLDYRLPIYEVSIDEIKITNIDNEVLLIDAANANLVALCFLIDASEEMIKKRGVLYECLGWGIVRAIDAKRNKALVLTPENVGSDFAKVTHFVVGVEFLPASFYMINDGASGPVPYVFEGKLVDFAQASKRSHLPPSKTRPKLLSDTSF